MVKSYIYNPNLVFINFYMFSYITIYLDRYKLFIFKPVVIISIFILFPYEAFVAAPYPETPMESYRTLPYYGRTDPIEPDWYAQDRSNVNTWQDEQLEVSPIVQKNSKFLKFYISLKTRTCWYMRQCHSKKYGSYGDLRKTGKFNISLSQDIRK